MNPNKDIHEIKQNLFEKYYAHLNKQQQEAVFTVKGPLLVIAGAGSGKTTVLVNRISHMIKYGDAYHSRKDVSASSEEMAMLDHMVRDYLMFDRDTIAACLTPFATETVKPDEILAITFTNKAAGEIRSRLQAELSGRSDQIWAGTFHSICVRLLRKFSDFTPYTNGFVIYDQDDSKKVITNLLKEKEINNQEITPKYVQSVISNAKNALQSPEEFFELNQGSEKRRICAEIFREYQKQLCDANAMDFDDLISVTVKMLQEEEIPRRWCQNKFRYVLVDEYQDTNHAQYLLIKLIAEIHQNVMVVGDDDQSIYKFRGAAVENILNFDKQFANTKVVFLEENYRSTKSIVEAANGLIAHNKSRRGKVLRSSAFPGKAVVFHQLMDQEKEALYLVDTINEKVIGKQCRYRDIAILYRTRAQGNVLETVFTKSGVPHRLLAGLRFYDHAEVKDIIAYLRLIQNKKDLVSLNRIINVPRRGIGQTTLEKIHSIAAQTNTDSYFVLANSNQYDEIKRNYAKLSEFSRLIDDLSAFSQCHLPSETVHAVIDRTGYMETLLGDENEERRKNVDELISSARFYEEKEDHPTLLGFLEEIALVSDVDNYDENSDSVVMMTIHASKGLEFPIVFLVGMEENLFPSAQSAYLESDLEEERRLAYVAMTRAERELYLTGAYQRMIYGKTGVNPVSRFVEEIPDRYLFKELYDANRERAFDHYLNSGYQRPTIHSVSTFDRRSTATIPSPLSNRYSEQKKEEKPASFNAGDRVIHGIFGSGTILEAKKYGSDTLYRIQFDHVGEKKLMGTYAKLKAEK